MADSLDPSERSTMPGDRFIELAQEEGLRVLESLFGRVAEGVSVQNSDGRLLYANDHAATMLGFASGRALVTTPVAELMDALDMIDETGAPFPQDRLPGRRVLAGEPLAQEILGYRGGAHGVRWLRVRSIPINDDSGRAVWAINYFHDVTAEFRRSAAERLLAGASLVLGSSLEVHENLQGLAALLVPEMGEWYGVHLLDEFEQLTQVAAAYPPSAAADRLLELSGGPRIDVNSESLAARVLRTGEAVTINDLSEDLLRGIDQSVATLVRDLGIGSVTCLPLGPRERPIGTLTLARAADRDGFDGLDLEVLGDIALSAATAVVNARLYDQERRVATLLSRSLLPKPPRRVEGLAIATRHRSSVRHGGLGGDFVETIALEDGSVAILVADIEGKGIDAAAAVGVVKYTFRAVVRLDPSPEAVVGLINDALLDQEHRRMCTFAYAWLRRVDGRLELTVAVAGHPPPVLIRGGAELVEVGEPCPPAGLLPDIAPKVQVETLVRGDTIIIYTDGFARRHETPPETMLTLLARSSHLDLDSMLDDLLARLDAEGDAVVDDVVILGVHIPSSG